MTAGVPDEAALEARARDAQRSAYAPYSKFRVGAAVRMTGEIFEGANVENASYGLGVCAERTAVFAAVIAGAHRLEAVVVCTDASPPSSPCGACRQVLFEFAPDPAAVTVTAINPHGERRSWTLAQLLPDGFSGRELPPPGGPAPGSPRDALPPSLLPGGPAPGFPRDSLPPGDAAPAAPRDSLPPGDAAPAAPRDSPDHFGSSPGSDGEA